MSVNIKKYIINTYWWESQKEKEHYEDQDIGG
jgi:hypothetical protein